MDLAGIEYSSSGIMGSLRSWLKELSYEEWEKLLLEVFDTSV